MPTTLPEPSWPGTPEHQALLRAVAAYYERDPRVRAVCVFGSLARGNWDSFSDLDLDIVVADDVVVKPVEELQRLCSSFTSLGETAALIIPDGPDFGDVVLASRRQLSVRYHTLDQTSPNITHGLRRIAGDLDVAAIVAAGEARAVARPADELIDRLLDRCVRYAVNVDTALRRGRLWLALELLHRMRSLLMLVFGRSRNRSRPDAVFEAEAGPGLQACLGATVPRFEAAAMQAALLALLDVVEHHLDELSAGQAALTDEQRSLIVAVRRGQSS